MIPICIQTIENDDDRDFMEWLFLEYHPLMCNHPEGHT